MADPKIAGVGAFGDLGTHKLDILMWMLGDLESVTGDIRAVTHRYGDCDETGEALLQFKSGVIGTLAAGWVDIEDPVKLQISGTQGHAVIFNDKLYYRSEKVDDSDNRKPQPAQIAAGADGPIPRRRGRGQKPAARHAPGSRRARHRHGRHLRSRRDRKWVKLA